MFVAKEKKIFKEKNMFNFQKFIKCEFSQSKCSFLNKKATYFVAKQEK